MKFNECITLDDYATKASKQFDDMEEHLSELDSSFHLRMDGKSRGKLVISFIGTLCWAIAYMFCFFYLKVLVEDFSVNVMLFEFSINITFFIILGLLLIMLLDTIQSLSYYGKISSYKNSVLQLQNRVNIGRNSIKSNHDVFLGSKSVGWNYVLNPGDSIPKMAISLENSVKNMEVLKKKITNVLKNILFYSSVIAVTVTAGITLFDAGEELIDWGLDIADFGSIDSDVYLVIGSIALVIATIIQIVFAKLIWGKTDCNVSNATLFIIPLGSVIFIALVALGTLITVAVIYVFAIVLVIAALAAAIGIACACSSGG